MQNQFVSKMDYQLQSWAGKIPEESDLRTIIIRLPIGLEMDLNAIKSNLENAGVEIQSMGKGTIVGITNLLGLLRIVQIDWVVSVSAPQIQNLKKFNTPDKSPKLH